MRRPVCLVTGATGAIGPGVVAAMSATHHVRTLSRRAPDPATFRVPVEAYTGDVTDRDAVHRAMHGAEVVVHLAALLHIVDPSPTMRAEYESINVAGTQTVIEAAQLTGVSRVVLMSTIAVYGYAGGGLLDEESPTAPDTLYGRTKLAAEQLALPARRTDGQPMATVLRSAAVYGPRVKGNYQRLVTALARRRFVPIGRGENLRTLIYEDDLAAATAVAALHPAAAGRVYNVSDGAPHPLSVIIDAISLALDRPPPRWHVPVAPVRAALRAASVIDRRLPRMLDKYLEAAAVDASRIQRELGFQATTGLVDGWRRTIETMRREGRL
ncbi:MAG: NAD-dependent epimerase/dehydratase family protein [Acidobacteria bacterium]|nr:NAD-dependent epimerase/dehydratase family protein [Acidobacteriota bacterium]